MEIWGGLQVMLGDKLKCNGCQKRLIHIDDITLTKKVFLYDFDLYSDNWCEVITWQSGTNTCFNNKKSCNICEW